MTKYAVEILSNIWVSISVRANSEEEAKEKAQKIFDKTVPDKIDKRISTNDGKDIVIGVRNEQKLDVFYKNLED